MENTSDEEEEEDKDEDDTDQSDKELPPPQSKKLRANDINGSAMLSCHAHHFSLIKGILFFNQDCRETDD